MVGGCGGICVVDPHCIAGLWKPPAPMFMGKALGCGCWRGCPKAPPPRNGLDAQFHQPESGFLGLGGGALILGPCTARRRRWFFRYLKQRNESRTAIMTIMNKEAEVPNVPQCSWNRCRPLDVCELMVVDESDSPVLTIGPLL